MTTVSMLFVCVYIDINISRHVASLILDKTTQFKMLATTLLAVLALSIPSSAKPCPPLGRTLPAPTAPSTNSAVKQAGEALAKQLQDALQPLLKQSAVSVAVKSLHEDKPLFNWHFTPTNMSGIGTTKVDENTIYRVGSFSKVVAALVALQSDNIDMQASVLKYLPDLKKSVSLDAHHFDWEDVTVESLASHLSGLPTSSKSIYGYFHTQELTNY